MDNERLAFELLRIAKELTAKSVPDNIKEAVEAASSFMNVGAELKKARIKYDFSTSPLPIYMIKVGGDKYAIINKKYADDPDLVVGDIAIGRLGRI
jgi:hypothetical protein